MDLSVAADFREHFTPESDTAAPKEQPRHWMLDHSTGRDLLKTFLRTQRPDLKVPTYSRGNASLDPMLDPIIDELGMRDLQEPKTVWAELNQSWCFFKMMAKQEWVAMFKDTKTAAT
jgi:hypothetical protein